jgi:hypothetical protein
VRKSLVAKMLISLLLVWVFALPAFGADNLTLSESLKQTVSYYEKDKSILDSWEEIIGLSNAGVDLSEDCWQLKAWDVDSLNESTDAAEYAKYILSMMAAGKDPRDVNGRNLVQELVHKQRENGGFGAELTTDIWSIAALDKAGADYAVADAVGWILNKQTSDGGFALSGDMADPDITGFTLIALASHKDLAGVSEAIEQAKNCLKGLQLESGGFGSPENSASISAVIRGLIACGENVISDEWTKNNNTIIDALMAYRLDDYSFCWKKDSPSTNQLCTRQSLIALADLVHKGYGDYIIKDLGTSGEEEPSGEIEVTVRVEGFEETGTILEKTSLKVAQGSKVFDALKKALDGAGISNSIDPAADWLNINDIALDTEKDLSSYYWIYTVNDDLNTGANSKLNSGDNITVYLSYYSQDLATVYGKLALSTEEAQKGETVTVTVYKSDGGWPAAYVPAAGVTVHFGSETYTTDEKGQVAIPLGVAGIYEVYAEKYHEGIPVIVKTEKKKIIVTESGSGSGKSCLVDIAIIGKKGKLLYGPAQVVVSKNGQYGLTVGGALDATPVNWHRLWDENYGTWYVDEIAGEHDEFPNGWCYTINGVLGGAAFEEPVNNKDKIIWYYSTSIDSAAPTWDEVLRLQGGSSGVSKVLDEKVTEASLKDTLNSYKDKLKNIQEEQIIINSDKSMSPKTAEEMKKELEDNRVSVSKEMSSTEGILGDEKQEIAMLIPENALNGKQKITINELAENQRPKHFAVQLASAVYEFGPQGTRFNTPVTLSIKVPVAEGMDVTKLLPAWFNEETKEWITLPAVLDLERGLVVFQIDHFTKFAVVQIPEKKKFTDVGEQLAWAKDAIEILGGKGIIKGTGSGFEPQRPITRAEFVKMIITALDMKTEGYKADLFSDVKSGDWFAGYVECACKNEIIKGDAQGKFRPNDNISRNEIAVILSRLQKTADLSTQNTALTFKDASQIPEWALKGVQDACGRGLIKGYQDETFRGANSLNRAEAAVIIYRYLKLTNI